MSGGARPSSGCRYGDIPPSDLSAPFVLWGAAQVLASLRQHTGAVPLGLGLGLGLA
jgi:hypothetical protein